MDAIAFTAPVGAPDLTRCGLCDAALPITPDGRRALIAHLGECVRCGAPKFDNKVPEPVADLLPEENENGAE